MANFVKSTVLFLVIGTGAAMAQSNLPPAGIVSDYDLGKPCRFYLMRHLPAPAHCLVEFQGAWGPGSYVDGEFIFRSRADWLAWRDREDYRHWQKHEFHWVSVGPAPAEPARPQGAILCPPQVAVKIVAGDPMALSGAGWTLNGSELAVRSSNAPRVDGANLVCRYRLGESDVLLYQSAASHKCAPRADQTGFDCEQ
jgi:hypothetical protein